MRRGRGAGSSNRVETSQLQEERIVVTETLYVIKNIFLSFILSTINSIQKIRHQNPFVIKDKISISLAIKVDKRNSLVSC